MLMESEIPLYIGSQNPSSTDKDWNPVPGIQYLESAIHGVESKLQEFVKLLLEAKGD